MIGRPWFTICAIAALAITVSINSARSTDSLNRRVDVSGFPGGSLFIPDSPYFLALYLCETEPTNKPFKGRYYHASGRFICVERPPLGTTVTTDFPIADTFRRIFGKEAPDISGIGLAIDTVNAK